MLDDHVLGTFTRRDDAEAALRTLDTRFPTATATWGSVDDELDALALGQRAEADESLPMLSSGLFTGPFARGAIIWGVVGLVVGAFVGLAFSWVIDAEGSQLQLALAFAFAGALAVSSATFVLGAGRQAIKEGETTPEDPTAVVRVDVGSEDTEPVVAALVDLGARHAFVVDRPVPRQATGEVEAPHQLHRPPVGSPEHEESDAGFKPDRT